MKFLTISICTALALCGTLAATTATTTTKKHHRKTTVTAKVAPATAVASTTSATAKKKLVTHAKIASGPWDEPTYKDSAAGDKVEGEDLVVRRAAVTALGPFNGSIVVVDPNSGRILTMVNQELTLGGGFQPCSTVKVSVALAALKEGLVKRLTPIRLPSRGSLDLTDALAYSNNYYFANLGVSLGYDRMNYYAHLFGYGEKAGINIEGEQPGAFPAAPPKNGGMGMLTSFGEEIAQTPLEFAGLMSAVANGGTLYWLQYPRSQKDVEQFEPQVKRHLDISGLIDTIKPGLRGAVAYGTAKRARQEEEIFGKTGTCSEGRVHLGWFGSFNEGGARKVVVVVMLTGGGPAIGAVASGIAGDVYKELDAEGYFRNKVAPLTPAMISLSPGILH